MCHLVTELGPYDESRSVRCHWIVVIACILSTGSAWVIAPHLHIINKVVLYLGTHRAQQHRSTVFRRTDNKLSTLRAES